MVGNSFKFPSKFNDYCESGGQGKYWLQLITRILNPPPPTPPHPTIGHLVDNQRTNRKHGQFDLTTFGRNCYQICVPMCIMCQKKNLNLSIKKPVSIEADTTCVLSGFCLQIPNTTRTSGQETRHIPLHLLQTARASFI